MSTATPEPAAAGGARSGVAPLVEHLFRRQYARMVAGLTRVFGGDCLDLVEDVVQEALLRALRRWPFEGIPREPEAWLVQVARNLALDALRRRALVERKRAELEQWAAAAARPSGGDLPPEVADDTLAMMFLCCQPGLPLDVRVALTLKTLGGFGVAEIARALLAKEATVAQRLTRAKARLQRAPAPFALPSVAELGGRMDAVLEVLYLMFNEGYAAAQGDDLVRGELVREAQRLADLVLAMPLLATPKVHALRALMAFQAARIPARTGSAGEPLTLAEQDRARWDRAALATGWCHFERSMAGDEMTPFHLEAAIASCHAAAPTWAATDWATILRRYDELVQQADSPIVRLNRAVAVAKVRGAAAGLAALEGLAGQLAGYWLLPATRAHLLWAAGDAGAAAQAFVAALQCPCSTPQRQFLAGRLAACRRGEAAPEF